MEKRLSNVKEIKKKKKNFVRFSFLYEYEAAAKDAKSKWIPKQSVTFETDVSSTIKLKKTL